MSIRSTERWQEIESFFTGALALPPEDRAVYLLKVCGDDAELKVEVERLLDASDQAGDFLDLLDTTVAARLLEADPASPEAIGRYQIVRTIGSGGMGVVYLAEDPALKRQVAVKLLAPWLRASSRANRRLLDEARAASAIDHPNIATVHEIGETEDGQLFITMGYYEGETLRARLQHGTISVDSAVNIAIQTASGLDAAHRKGIIHRDIKPENLLIDSDGRIKIVDFGLAGIAEHEGPGGLRAGTAAYMSPEQTLGTRLDARTDLWSLGVVLHEMLAGERPFTGATAGVLSIPNDLPAANERLMRDVPFPLRKIVQRCLEKDPSRRYESASEVVRDLKAVGDHGTPGAASSPERVAKSLSPRKRAVVLGAAAVVMLGVVGTAAAWRNGRTGTSDRTSGAQSGRVAAAATSSVQGSVAVMPFADMSADADLGYLSDGITEELIYALAGVEQLHVVARSSVFGMKNKGMDVRQAGAMLGVSHILEGSVRSERGRLRITVRLADTEKGYEVWSQVYDRPDRDMLAVQAEISKAVVAALRVQLAPGEGAAISASDPDAYRLYLKGQHLFNQRSGLDQAVKYFKAAIAIDPEFARAWTGLGKTWLIMPVYSDVPFPVALDSAKAAIGKGLSLDPELGEAHAAFASMSADDWKWRDAESHFTRALQANGGDAITHQWYGEMLLRTGRVAEAVDHLKAARRLDPLNSVIPMNLGWANLASGRVGDASAAFREALELNPLDVQAHVGSGYVLLEVRRFNEAIGALQKAVELVDGERGTRAHLARGYALAGRRSEALKILDELRTEAASGGGSAWGVALVAAAAGKNDEAFRWLENSLQRREVGISYLKTSHAFKGLRSDERFTSLLRRMGLQQPAGGAAIRP